jgi:hypothetical protein
LNLFSAVRGRGVGLRGVFAFSVIVILLMQTKQEDRLHELIRQLA